MTKMKCKAIQPTFFGEVCGEPVERLSNGKLRHVNADKKTYDHEPKV